MRYKIVAYGPRMECLMWAENETELSFKTAQLRQEGYITINVFKEEV